MSRIQLPYGEVIDKNRETVILDLPKNLKNLESEYFRFLSYLNDVERSNFQTSISNFISNRYDLRNYLLATVDIGKSIQENLKLVFIDGKLNDVVIVHVLDTRDKHILADPKLLQVKFKGIKNLMGKILLLVKC